MTNLFAISSPVKTQKRALWAVMMIGLLMVLPGCRIPQLCCALPGPSLPASFQRPTKWVVQDIVWPDQDTSSADDNRGPGDEEPEPGDEETRSDGEAFFKGENGDGPFTLASFLASATSSDDSESAGLEGGPANSDDDGTSLEGGATDTDDVVPMLDYGVAIPGGDVVVPDSVIPDSVVPDSVVPDSGVTSWENSSHLTWNQFFDDPMLAALIDQALIGNQELKILSQEIRIANNEVDARRGEYLPFVNIGAGAGLDKVSHFTREGAVEEELEVAPGKGFPDPLPDFLIAADVSWEVDIWRKLRNARDAAAFRYLGTRDGQAYVVTRLVAEVAENYYELLALDNRLETLDKTIEIQQQSLKVAEAKKAAARGTELAVQRFQAEVRKNQSEKLIIQQEIIEVENRINFLLGRYPQDVERVSLDYIDLNLRALNVGVPSQLLCNRPDIRQAERELAAAGLDVQVARARFYPSLDITAGVGYQAFNTRFLFITPEALIYNVVGDLVMPVINRKAIKAAYRNANAKQIQSVYNYQRTVLNAYTEVVNHMTKVENYGQSIEIKKQQLAALEASVDSAGKLFQNARAEYVEVLLAQRELNEARFVLIETKRQQLAAVVNTYQALGGGSLSNPN